MFCSLGGVLIDSGAWDCCALDLPVTSNAAGIIAENCRNNPTAQLVE
jgi:hypothetical protein